MRQIGRLAHQPHGMAKGLERARPMIQYCQRKTTICPANVDDSSSVRGIAASFPAAGAPQPRELDVALIFDGYPPRKKLPVWRECEVGRAVRSVNRALNKVSEKNIDAIEAPATPWARFRISLRRKSGPWKPVDGYVGNLVSHFREIRDVVLREFRISEWRAPRACR
jgi:hypothetical protein